MYLCVVAIFYVQLVNVPVQVCWNLHGLSVVVCNCMSTIPTSFATSLVC